MEQRSLRVVETNKTFFNKISNTISKLLVPTRLGFNNMMISIKRNSVIKAYANYVGVGKRADEELKDVASKKYEDAYSLYLEAIDKNIMDSLYKKVKNGIANSFEKEALAGYYFVVSLKNDHYLEYRYKKQEYLLKIDYETASNIKKESILNLYKEFYVSKMDAIYKGLLKNYSIEITDNIKKDISSEKIYDKIFTALETYVSEILPIKISLSEENKKYQEDYDKYQEKSIGKLNEQEKIIKKMTLLEISRKFFTHSLPLGATENCYNWLLDNIRLSIVNETNKKKQENMYDVLINVLESYNNNLLEGKVYWDDQQAKEKYKNFSDKYHKILALEDENEKNEQRKIIFIKDDLQRVFLNQRKNMKIIAIYKKYLVELGAIKELKNKCTTKQEKYIGAKIWSMQK